jgi:hypothetical protein
MRLLKVLYAIGASEKLYRCSPTRNLVGPAGLLPKASVVFKNHLRPGIETDRGSSLRDHVASCFVPLSLLVLL